LIRIIFNNTSITIIGLPDQITWINIDFEAGRFSGEHAFTATKETIVLKKLIVLGCSREADSGPKKI